MILPLAITLTEYFTARTSGAEREPLAEETDLPAGIKHEAGFRFRDRLRNGHSGRRNRKEHERRPRGPDAEDGRFP